MSVNQEINMKIVVIGGSGLIGKKRFRLFGHPPATSATKAVPCVPLE